MYYDKKKYNKTIKSVSDKLEISNGYGLRPMVIEDGNDYIVSIAEAQKNQKNLVKSFTFRLAYKGEEIFETNVERVVFYEHIIGDYYNAVFYENHILEVKDIHDFCMFIYKHAMKGGNNTRDVCIYRGFNKVAEIAGVYRFGIRHFWMDFSKGNTINISKFCFLRDFLPIGGEYKAKRFALIDYKERSENDLDLSLKEWNNIFSDSNNKYCDLCSLYSPDNTTPIDDDSLKWNCDVMCTWTCTFGHVWTETPLKLTKSISVNNPCPICNKEIKGLHPRINDAYSDMIVDSVKRVMGFYSIDNLKDLHDIVNSEVIRMRAIIYPDGEHELQYHESWISQEFDKDYVKYYFVYPSGKQSDVDMYICDHYGKVSEIQDFLYEAVIPIEERDQLVALSEGGGVPGEYAEFLSIEPSRFMRDSCSYNIDMMDYLEQNHLYFRYKRLVAVKQFLEVGSLNPQEYERDFIKGPPGVREYREKIYNQVVYEGKASGKWTSEQSLYRLVRGYCPDAVYQYRCAWLEPQSLDIYIPALKIGIEYQGIQHYEALDIFGGKEGFDMRVKLDKKKKKLCKENGVKLLEWKYTMEIKPDMVKAFLRDWLNKHLE